MADPVNLVRQNAFTAQAGVRQRACSLQFDLFRNLRGAFGCFNLYEPGKGELRGHAEVNECGSACELSLGTDKLKRSDKLRHTSVASEWQQQTLAIHLMTLGVDVLKIV